MTTIRVYHADLLTGTTYGALPVTSVSYTDIISAPGSFEIVIPARDASERNITESMIALGKTSVWIERNGTLLFGGIAWTRQDDPANNYITINGEGFHSYLRKRNIWDDLIFTGVEQQSIAAQLISYAAGKQYGDVGITVPTSFTPSGNADRTYQGVQGAEIGHAIEDFASVADGFDFRYPPYRDATGRLRVQFSPQFPVTGRPTPYQFVLGVNCQALSSQADATDMATQAIAVGAANGSTAPRAQAPASTLGTWPLIERVDSYSDVTDVGILQAKANVVATQNDKPIPLPQIQVSPDADPPIGSYAPGDAVRVYGRYGLTNINGTYKVQQLTYSANAEDGETVTLTVADQGVFSDGN